MSCTGTDNRNYFDKRNIATAFIDNELHTNIRFMSCLRGRSSEKAPCHPLCPGLKSSVAKCSMMGDGAIWCLLIHNQAENTLQESTSIVFVVNRPSWTNSFIGRGTRVVPVVRTGPGPDKYTGSSNTAENGSDYGIGHLHPQDLPGCLAYDNICSTGASTGLTRLLSIQ
jgi:hypothetical protein